MNMTQHPSVFGARAQGARLERMRASAQFRDGGFVNTQPVGAGFKPGTLLPTLRDYFFGGQTRVPAGLLPSDNPLVAWGRPVGSGLRVTWLGHSTVLLEIDGHRVLTDPVWGMRASPFAFAGPRRFQPMPVEVEALPALDAVIISHDHYDHLDLPTIRRLANMGMPFVTSLGVGAHLQAWGVPAERIRELDWWESTELPCGLTVTAAPAQHFSGRGMGDRNTTLWSSLVVRGPRHAVFFSGDTGLTEQYREIGERLGPFDLNLIEVGAWNAAWADIHLGPRNALAAHAMLGSGMLLPVHWGTFNMAVHAWDEPAETLVQLAEAAQARLMMPRMGQVVEPSRAERVEPWWRAVGTEVLHTPDPVRQI